MSKKFQNKRKDRFITSLPNTSLNSSNIKSRSKFNFSYLDFTQGKISSLAEYGQTNTEKLIEKIKNYCQEPLSYWQKEKCGHGGQHVLEIYKNFPAKSDFTHPKQVPHDVWWGRFRLDRTQRLAGFVIPTDQPALLQSDDGIPYDPNTFYIVFIDTDHQFYKTAK